jgi:hypothetical protein
VLAAVVGVLALLALAYDPILAAMWLPFGWRVAAAVLLLTPPAFMMGMCFPLGIQKVRCIESRLVPWCWGVNGACSVMATTAALVLALHLGLKFTVWTGIACYVAAGVAALSMASVPVSQSVFSLHDRRPAEAVRRRRKAHAFAIAAVLAILVAGGMIYLRQHERARFARVKAEQTISEVDGKSAQRPDAKPPVK